jgi:superfamily I DNA/RNA helicase
MTVPTHSERTAHEGSSIEQIAQAPDKRLRVRAGPGTGKTTALMKRVENLLKRGVEPESIFVATFTRTAARDLERELANLQVPGADRVQVGTLHRFCFSLLSRAEVLFITGRVPRPLLKFEERFLLEDLKTKLNQGVKQLRGRLHAFGAAWARLQSEDPGWPREPADQEFHKALMDWLVFHKAMLIEELVPETLKFLKNNPASASVPHFQHILVDEYQDLNRAEQELLQVLAKDSNLVVVGDEHQSIYGFKFAHPEGILEFDKSNPGTRDFALDTCRRCPALVVQLANTLMQHNTLLQPRKLTPAPDSASGIVDIVQWRSLEEEAKGLAAFIRHCVSEGHLGPGEILVLAPRRQIGHAIRDALKAYSVPACSFFYQDVLEGDPTSPNDSEAQKAFCLLTLLADPDDRVALRCWCGFGNRSLRSGAWAELRAKCEEADCSPRDLLAELTRNNRPDRHTRELVTRHRELQERLKRLQSLSGRELLDELFPPTREWAEGLQALAPGDEEFSARDLFDELRNAIIHPEMPTDVGYVRVMSLHKAKGLSAKLVLVAGCVEGLIPSIPGTRVSEKDVRRALEEQRRLFYVAITRTRQRLVLSSVARVPPKEAHKMGARIRRSGDTIASRFLSELGTDAPRPKTGRQWLQEQGIRL